jgi:hypothetical protein
MQMKIQIVEWAYITGVHRINKIIYNLWTD